MKVLTKALTRALRGQGTDEEQVDSHSGSALQKGIVKVTKATEEDKAGNYKEALNLYSKGIEYFLHASKYEVSSQEAKETLRVKLGHYMTRVHALMGHLKNDDSDEEIESMSDDLYFTEEENTYIKESLLNIERKADKPWMWTTCSNSTKNRETSRYSSEETLSGDNFRHDIVRREGCYTANSLDARGFPAIILKVDFHGDAKVTDSFINLLATNSHLSYTWVQMVDFRGCSNLTDIGIAWLSSLLATSQDLHTILLDGCHQVTGRGVASFQHLPVRPTISVVGTSVATLPRSLWNNVHLDGCPMLKQRMEDEEEVVSMDNLIIHPKDSFKYDLSAVLTGDNSETDDKLKYQQSWLCGETDYSILQTSLKDPANHLLGLADSHQVLIPVDMEDPIETSVEHITDVVQNHMLLSNTIVPERANFPRYIVPDKLHSCFWDDIKGSVKFLAITTELVGVPAIDYTAKEEEEIIDDVQGIRENTTSRQFHTSILFDKDHPDLEFRVECDPVKGMLTKSTMWDHEEKFSRSCEFTLKDGDVVKFGITNPESMKNSLVIDGEEHDFYLTIANPKKDENKKSCILFHFKGDRLDGNAPCLMDLKEYIEEQGVSCGIMEFEMKDSMPNCDSCVFCVSEEFTSSDNFQIPGPLTSQNDYTLLVIDGTWKSWKNSGSEEDIGLGAKTKKGDLLQMEDRQKNVLIGFTKETHEKVGRLAINNNRPYVHYQKHIPHVKCRFNGAKFDLPLLSRDPGVITFAAHQPMKNNEGLSANRMLAPNALSPIPLSGKVIDYSNGIVFSEADKKYSIKSHHPIAHNNTEWSVKVDWSPEGEKQHRRIVIGIDGDRMDQERSRKMIDNDETPPTGYALQRFHLEESGGDVIRISIRGIETHVLPFKEYNVDFYRNDEKVCTQLFRQTGKSRETYGRSSDIYAPVFMVMVEKDTEIHMQNYCPPLWFSDQMDLASQLPDSCFLLPGWVSYTTAVTNTCIKSHTELSPFDNPSSFRGQTSLTVHHPVFELTVIHKHHGNTGLYVGANHMMNTADTFGGENGYRPKRVQVDDVISCRMKTEGLRFDRFGIPLPHQTVSLIFMHNNEKAQQIDIDYKLGGLNPFMTFEGVTLRLNNMNLEETRVFQQRVFQPRAQPTVPSKKFVVVAMTEDSTTKESKLQALQKDCLQHIVTKTNEFMSTLDAFADKISISFCGDLVRNRLEIQKKSLKCLTESELRSVMAFTALHTQTKEGYDTLCDLITQKQKSLITEEAHIYKHTHEIRRTIQSILNTEEKVISRESCSGRWRLSEQQLIAVFRLLHSWGKVIFLHDADTWIVVLDVPWFISILQKIRSPEETGSTADGMVRCLHPTTSVWEDHDLINTDKEMGEAEQKLVLEVLLASHQLMRLPAMRKGSDDTASYLVSPCSIKDPGVPLSHFYNPGDSNILTVTTTFSIPTGLDPGLQQTVVCEAARVTPPILLAPTYLVWMVGASQVIITWSSEHSDLTPKELRLLVSTFAPEEEPATQEVVAEYALTVVHIFEDVISHTLLASNTQFTMTCDSSVQRENQSICSSHRWTTDIREKSVSVCSLCMCCSQEGLLCPYNQVLGTYDVLQCQCQPIITCCQDCGLCQSCARHLWSLRSKLRPATNIQEHILTQPLGSGELSHINVMMTPAIFDEATVTKTKESDNLQALNIGLISEDKEHFIQLFPGKAVIGRADQGYHQKTRNTLTLHQTQIDSKFDFNLGDQVNINLSEPKVQSLDYRKQLEKEDFCVNMLCKVNCSLSRATNIVRCRSSEGIGMVVSHLPASDQCLYFDAEIITLSGDNIIGIGMTPTTQITDCIAHGIDHDVTKGCEAWGSIHCKIGDVIGCGTWLVKGEQKIVFSHNDQVVCRHVIDEPGPLHAAILVSPGEAIRIMRSDIWNHPKTIRVESEFRMPTDQEVFESADGTVRICPKKTLLFDHQRQGGKLPVSSIYIENNGQDHLLWKVRTNEQANYISNPNKGIIKPGEISEIVNECKSDVRDMTSDRFQIAYVPLQSYEVANGGLDIERAAELWDLKKSQGIRESSHVVSCQSKAKHDQADQKETNFPAELDDTSYAPVEPSFKVTVRKNGAVVGSYWLPKGDYQLGIERIAIDGPPSGVSVLEDIALHVPKLPSRGEGMDTNMVHKEENESGTTFAGTSCEKLLFGVHAVQFRHHENLKFYRFDTSYMFLPAKLTYDVLRHPSLQQLHNGENQNIYPVCHGLGKKHNSFQNTYHLTSGLNQESHIMDLPSYTPEDSISYSFVYRVPEIMYNYNNLASKKVLLPSHSELVQDGQPLVRHQLEFFLTSMLRTYVLTAKLLTMPECLKYSEAKKEQGNFWDPDCVLPLDYAADNICSIHSETEVAMDMTQPYVELAESCCFRQNDDTVRSLKPLEVLSASAEDVQESLTKTPYLKFLMIEGNISGSDVHISLPELTEFVKIQSECNVFINNSPKLKIWKGTIQTDVARQLEILSRCYMLEKLVIGENCIEQLPESIGQLKMLTTLHIEHSHLTDLPASFTCLKNLRELKIDALTEITTVVNSKYVSEESKKVLQDISSKDLTNDQRGKQVSAVFSIGRRFGQKPDGVLGGFPKEILQLTNLQYLCLKNQAMRAIPPQISRLENLETLVLDGCLQLETLPSTLGFLPLKRLSLNFCHSLRTPSREIVDQGTEAMRAYLKQMARGKKKNWRTKLMLVGIGSAGKTTLLRALRSSSHTAKATSEQEITHGIDITPWTASDEQNHPGKKVVFSAWDFAGQTVFYNTHQFFMSDRAVYLLVWSTRQGFENSRLEFWLSSIQCHSPDAPVFIVATHADRLTTDLPRGQLRKQYPQIRDFIFVGSTTGKGIPELKTAILNAALEQDYMGEEIPTVYLDLENKILSLRDKDSPYIKWSVVKEYAKEAGIFDEKDVVRAVQFLQHIGSVQYFDYELLRDYVIIDPRWIVNAFASIITFQDSVIKNGRLYHKHMPQLWKKYPVNIHDWLLRLTEMFDLTFQIKKDLSLVPCLLSNEQPEQAKWPPVSDDIESMSMMMIVYTFRYLPTGLFNRLQSRLFEFSNGKTVWKRGSILEKKGQYAYLEHEENEKLVVQVLGQHPENILFLIHETLEDLINNSYRGVRFEYLIPCPDCVKVVGMDSPAMFEASMIREAAKCSAPYIQCRRLFHTVPMNLAKALMPPDDNQELDLQLQRSMQSLGEMRSSLQTDVFVLFSPDDLLDETKRKTKVDPFMVVQALRRNFTCFFDDKINEINIQSLMVSMQEAKTLIVFISNNFVKDDQCSQLLQYAHSAFQDRLCLVNLSMDYAWKQETAGFMLSQKVFVNMKSYDEENFKSQMNQIKKNLEDLLGRGSEKKEKETEPVCFISYCWSNSKAANAIRRVVKKEATACDPREFKECIEKEIGVPCWLDIEQTGKKGLYEDITEGLRAAEVVVAFVSNEYLASANCMMELRFAISTLKLPTILVAVGNDMDWQYEEIGTLQRNAKAEVVDMRHEVNNDDMKVVLDFVKSKLLTPEQCTQKQKKMKSKINKMSIVELANISYTEEFELIQRKMMRRLTSLASHQSANPYPHVFTLDFSDANTEASNRTPSRQRPGSGRKGLERRTSAHHRQMSNDNDFSASNKLNFEDTLCIRFLCEHDAGWHATKDALLLHDLTVPQKESLLESMAPYMARMLTILEHSSVPLNCLKGDKGAAFKEHLVKLAHCTQSKDSFENSYQDMLQYVMEQDTDITRGSLKECVLSGGRTRWLCPHHQKGYRVTVLTTNIVQHTSTSQDHQDYVKALMDGLREFKDKASHRDGTNKEKKHHGPQDRNICDVLATARLGTLTPRTEGILSTGLMEFGTLILPHTQELNIKNLTKEITERPIKEVPEDKRTVEEPKRPPSALKKPSRKRRTNSGSSGPMAGSSSSNGEQGNSRPLKKVSFKDSAERVGVEQKQAAVQKLKDMGVQENVVKSKACVLQ